jgi:hypothetical protein
LALGTALAFAAEKFPPISGEIYGQTVPGVKSITVNGKPVAIDHNLNFRTTVNLGSGEKYLTLNINYGSFRIVKKYLIVRKPQVKTFKVFVPKEKIQKPARIAPVQKKMTRSAKKKRLLHLKLQKRLNQAFSKTTPARLKARPAKPKGDNYEFVWEFSPGKLLLVKSVKGVYTADIFVPSTQEWYSLKGISRQELREIVQ